MCFYSTNLAIMQMLTGSNVIVKTPWLTFRMRSPTARVPSSSAGPPGMILVRKIPSSPRTCWLPCPPAMLKPRPGRRDKMASQSMPKGLCTHSRRKWFYIHVRIYVHMYTVFLWTDATAISCSVLCGYYSRAAYIFLESLQTTTAG